MARRSLTTRVAIIGGDEAARDLDQIGQRGQTSLQRVQNAAQRASQAGERLSGSVTNLGGRFAQLQGEVSGARREMQLLEQTEPGVRRLATVVTRLAGILVTAFAVRRWAQISTEFSFLQDRIRAVNDDSIELSETMDRLRRIANQVGEDYETVSRNFADQATVLKDLNLSTREQLDLTEAITLALGLSGLHGQEAVQMQHQLAEAMVRGNLESRQLRRVLERGGVVVRLLAQELNVGANAIREMGEQGLITSQLLSRVLLGSLDDLRSEAVGSAVTIGDAVTVLQNNLFHFVGSADQATGAGAALARVILLLARNVDIAVPAIAGMIGLWATWRTLALIRDIYLMARGFVLLAAGTTLASLPLILLIGSIAALAFAVAHFTGLLDPLYERLGLTGEASDEAAAGAERMGQSFAGAGDRIAAAGDDAAAAASDVAGAARAAGSAISADMGGAADDTRGAFGTALPAVEGMFGELGSEGDAVNARLASGLERLIRLAGEAARAIGGIDGSAAGGPVGFARGGMVRGRGTSTSDSILARVSRGEYVMRAAAVRRYGVGLFERLNRLGASVNSLPGALRGFADGGLVGALTSGIAAAPLAGAARLPEPAAGGPSGRPLALTIGGETFAGLIAPEDVAERLVRFATLSHSRSLGRKPSWYGG